MRRLLLLAAALLPAASLVPTPGLAQPRAFTCVGADRLEDDVFAIPFAAGAAAPAETARANLAAAAALAQREPSRNLCVLGHAGPQEGGAQAGVQLAARRAAAVAQALGRLGVERDRIRAEARRAAFARAVAPAERSVTIVLMPGLAPRPAPVAPTPTAPTPTAPTPATPAPAATPAPPPATPAPPAAPEARP